MSILNETSNSSGWQKNQKTVFSKLSFNNSKISNKAQ